jgi:sulfoxide reductase heme-binding subunit YedZ
VAAPVRTEPRWFKPVLWAGCLAPLVYVAGAMASDVLNGTRYLSSDPIKEGEHFLGDWTLRFLMFTLAVRPLRELLHLGWLGKHRRTLGLFAFTALMLHWLTYALLDVQLDWATLKKDLVARPYIMIGMAGLLLMLPLALTSSAAAIRKLGGAGWRRLHRLVYVVCVLGVVHYWMSVKADVSGPLTDAAVFAVLLSYRLVSWWRRRGAAPAPAQRAAAGETP